MPSILRDDDSQIVNKLFHLLATKNRRIALAESCTAGLASALLATTAGTSQVLAGSLVTYHPYTKEAWLGIDPAQVLLHTAESAEITQLMAEAAMRKTPHADVAIAITGHLGPDAPEGKDGVIYVSFKARDLGKTHTRKIQLKSTERGDRQYEAAMGLIGYAIEQIERADRG